MSLKENDIYAEAKAEARREEMYRDSANGLTIDLSGPDGNALFLMGWTRKNAASLGLDGDALVAEMMAGDYENLLDVFEGAFGNVVTLVNRP